MTQVTTYLLLIAIRKGYFKPIKTESAGVTSVYLRQNIHFMKGKNLSSLSQLFEETH
jgi:hypothetical protein